MKNIAATIISPDYLDRALLTNQSMNDWGATDMRVLVVGEPQDLSHLNKHFYGNIKFYNLDEIDSQHLTSRYGYNSDSLRWALKPTFLLHLLEKENLEKVFCVDCDIYFVNNYDFLSHDLDLYGITLTPHWRTLDPSECPLEFETNFRHGIFNAGFVGVSQLGLTVLRWWKKACDYRCEKDQWSNLYVDQKYLDLVPVFFPNETKIIRHQGCNVAIWNTLVCRRKKLNNTVIINDRYPVIFLHMSVDTLRLIPENDKALNSYRDVYIKELGVVREDIKHYKLELRNDSRHSGNQQQVENKPSGPVPKTGA